MVPVEVPLGAPAGAGADVSLLDAPAVDVDLREHPPIAVLSQWPQRHFTRGDQRLQAALGRRPASLVHLRCVNIRQANFLAVADQRVAIDGNAALAGDSAQRTKAAQQQEEHTHACYNAAVKLRTTALCALLLLWSSALRAQWVELHWADPRLDWRTLETEHFLVHFAAQYRAQARVAAASAERVYPRVTALLDWRPRLKTHLVLFDSADFSNGFASPIPFNFTGIFLTPPDEGELLQNREWLELVLSHEYFHIVHLDKASGSPLNLRDVLGRLIPFFPNVLQPSWIIEGLAVNYESDPARSYGRLGNTQFEGMMRAEVARGLRSLREINGEGRGFPLNRDYLYGSYFFAFLRERYGESAVVRFIEGYSGNLLPFKVYSNPVAVTGKPMDVLWVEYQDWLRARFAPQAASPAEGEVLLRAFSISSPVLTPDGARWYVQADGYTRPRIVRQAPGEAPRALRDTEQDTRMTAGAADDVLVSQLEVCRNYNLLYDLHRVDARGQRSTISECARHRLAAPVGGSQIAAVSISAGATEVVVLAQGKPVRSLYHSAPGESISGLAARGDRVVVTTLRNGRWSLVDVSDGTPTVLAADEAIKHSPRFGETADEVFFVADYGKVYDVWSWRHGGTSLSRWTRSAFGVREISAPLRGELLLTTIEADGDALRLQRLPPEPLERRDLQLELSFAPAPPAAAAAIEDRPYAPWPSLRPTAWLPLIQLADGAVALGALVYGTDALERHEYLLAPMVEFTQGELLGRADYVYDGRHGVTLERTLSVRATEEEGSRTKIRAYSTSEHAQWVSLWRSLALNRRWYWGLGAATDQEHFYDVGGGSARVQNERVVGLLARYDSRREQWLSDGPSQGQELRLFAETSNGLGADYSGNVVRADWRAHLPLGKTVLALRWNELRGQREAEPFELGGSKSDSLILLPQLNERDFALRGYNLGTPELTGHRARVISAEWRAPLADIDRHVMVPPVGINRVSLALFFDVGAAWEQDRSPDYHRGVGAEFIVEPRFGYLFGLQSRAGFARGLDTTGSTKIYLRVGRAF